MRRALLLPLVALLVAGCSGSRHAAPPTTTVRRRLGLASSAPGNLSKPDGLDLLPALAASFDRVVGATARPPAAGKTARTCSR